MIAGSDNIEWSRGRFIGRSPIGRTTESKQRLRAAERIAPDHGMRGRRRGQQRQARRMARACDLMELLLIGGEEVSVFGVQ